MRTKRPDFAEIKKTADIAQVVRSYGIELKPSSQGDLKGLCPFHDDTKPSLMVTPAKGLFHCMACGTAGNVIQFVAKKAGLTEREAALKLLSELPGISLGSELTTKDEVVVDPLADVELFAAIIDHYGEALFGRNKRGLNYLSRRNLGDIEALKHFKVGFVDGTLKEKLSASQLETAKVLGLVNAKGNEKFFNRVVVPIFDSNGSAVGLYGRDIGGESEVPHLYLAGGHRAVWNAQAASVYPEELICTESILDGLAVWMRGERKNVVAAFGARGWTAHHTKLLKTSGTKKLILAFDADETGQERARELATELTEKLSLSCHRIKWPEHVKDANDYFLHNAEADFKGGAKSFAALLTQAPRIGFKKAETSTLTLLEQTEEAAIFQNGTVNYKVRGGMGGLGGSGGGVSNMKVILTATAGDRNHTDRLDLYASRSRKGFSGTAAERLQLDPQKVEAHLLELLDQLEKLKESTAQINEEAPQEMSDSERAAALKLLQSPHYFQTLAKHISAIGYVGEDRNKQLTYVIASSRRLPKPLSGIVRSQSGAGKSYLMECVAELMPPEDVHFFSRLTPQALYYLERDALQHKLLIVDERNGSEESEYPIRTLQTRKVLKLAVPVKDPNSGRIKTETLEILGPIAYMESTTSQKVNPENENRCFEIYLDESDKQTKAIFAAQRKSRTLHGWKIERQKDNIRQLHHNAQRLLRPLKVIIPFVDLIDFPQSWLRGRRDHDRFLSLIEGIAFLHQHQRKIGASGEHEYIEASVDDYAHAHSLAQSIFTNTLGDLPKPVADLLKQIEKMNLKEFTRRDVREFTRLPDHLIKRQIRTLEDLEYLHVTRAPNGGRYHYKLDSQNTSGTALEGLTPPQDLAQRWKKAGQPGQSRTSDLSRSK